MDKGKEKEGWIDEGREKCEQQQEQQQQTIPKSSFYLIFKNKTHYYFIERTPTSTKNTKKNDATIIYS